VQFGEQFAVAAGDCSGVVAAGFRACGGAHAPQCSSMRSSNAPASACESPTGTSRPSPLRQPPHGAHCGQVPFVLTVAHGRGTFVRPRPNRRLILTATDGEHPDFLNPDYDTFSQGWEHTTVPGDSPPDTETIPLAHYQPYPNAATAEVAELLGIRRGRLTVVRHTYWQNTANRVRLHLTSTITMDLLNHQPRLQPAEYYPHLHATYGPIRWSTTVHAAMPHADLIEDLELEPTGSPLLVVRRIMLAHDGRPLEYTDIEAPADRFEAAATIPDATDSDNYIALRV
jgi:GntR family transcriptional regulator